ncbi:MAG: hypothetical protein JSS49_30120 [Planctomycetes bacterium]|nr:hypothetical protein [Planctomycetota bacterium]
MSWHNPQTQQVRWIDALNTGSDEIPGHAVLYINSAGLASEYGADIDSDPYVLEVVKFTKDLATAVSSVNTSGPYGYGPTCEIREQYHDIMQVFCVNGPVPIPPGQMGVVTLDPPFIALCDAGEIDVLVPLADSWHLVTPKASSPECADPAHWAEWFRPLMDMRPLETGVKPYFVDLDSTLAGFTGEELS